MGFPVIGVGKQMVGQQALMNYLKNHWGNLTWSQGAANQLQLPRGIGFSPDGRAFSAVLQTPNGRGSVTQTADGGKFHQAVIVDNNSAALFRQRGGVSPEDLGLKKTAQNDGSTRYDGTTRDGVKMQIVVPPGYTALLSAKPDLNALLQWAPQNQPLRNQLPNGNALAEAHGQIQDDDLEALGGAEQLGGGALGAERLRRSKLSDYDAAYYALAWNANRDPNLSPLSPHLPKIISKITDNRDKPPHEQDLELNNFTKALADSYRTYLPPSGKGIGSPTEALIRRYLNGQFDAQNTKEWMNESADIYHVKNGVPDLAKGKKEALEVLGNAGANLQGRSAGILADSSPKARAGFFLVDLKQAATHPARQGGQSERARTLIEKEFLPLLDLYRDPEMSPQARQAQLEVFLRKGFQQEKEAGTFTPPAISPALVEKIDKELAQTVNMTAPRLEQKRI